MVSQQSCNKEAVTSHICIQDYSIPPRIALLSSITVLFCPKQHINRTLMIRYMSKSQEWKNDEKWLKFVYVCIFYESICAQDPKFAKLAESFAQGFTIIIIILRVL